MGEFRLAPSVVAGLLGNSEGIIPAEGLARWRLEEKALRVLGADAVGCWWVRAGCRLRVLMPGREGSGRYRLGVKK